MVIFLVFVFRGKAGDSGRSQERPGVFKKVPGNNDRRKGGKSSKRCRSIVLREWMRPRGGGFRKGPTREKKTIRATGTQVNRDQSIVIKRYQQEAKGKDGKKTLGIEKRKKGERKKGNGRGCTKKTRVKGKERRTKEWQNRVAPPCQKLEIGQGLEGFLLEGMASLKKNSERAGEKKAPVITADKDRKSKRKGESLPRKKEGAEKKARGSKKEEGPNDSLNESGTRR